MSPTPDLTSWGLKYNFEEGLAEETAVYTYIIYSNDVQFVES
jgi:hypothetical protein